MTASERLNLLASVYLKREDKQKLIDASYQFLLPRIKAHKDEEIESEAYQAILQAIDSYTLGKSLYTTWLIGCFIGRVKHWYRDQNALVHIPAWVQELMYKTCKKANVLSSKLNRDVTPIEAIDSMEVSEECKDTLRGAFLIQNVVRFGLPHSIQDGDDGETDETTVLRKYYPKAEDPLIDEKMMFEVLLEIKKTEEKPYLKIKKFLGVADGTAKTISKWLDPYIS